jgi:hypothetical protein
VIQSRIAHTYAVGDLVLMQLNRCLLPKLTSPTYGPYRVIKVNFNGMVVIQRWSNAETINICCLTPFLASSTVPLDVGGTMPEAALQMVYSRLGLKLPISTSFRMRCNPTTYLMFHQEGYLLAI